MDGLISGPAIAVSYQSKPSGQIEGRILFNIKIQEESFGKIRGIPKPCCCCCRCC